MEVHGAAIRRQAYVSLGLTERTVAEPIAACVVGRVISVDALHVLRDHVLDSIGGLRPGHTGPL